MPGPPTLRDSESNVVERASSKRIAVVEDDADLAFSIVLNLEREGYKVEHYASGSEGLMAVKGLSA